MIQEPQHEKIDGLLLKKIASRSKENKVVYIFELERIAHIEGIMATKSDIMNSIERISQWLDSTGSSVKIARRLDSVGYTRRELEKGGLE